VWGGLTTLGTAPLSLNARDDAYNFIHKLNFASAHTTFDREEATLTIEGGLTAARAARETKIWRAQVEQETRGVRCEPLRGQL
jgi:hypothetical protein